MVGEKWKNRVFSHDVKAAISVSQNNNGHVGVPSQSCTIYVRVEFLSYANAFFCSNKFA